MKTHVVYPPPDGNQNLKTGAYHDVAVGKVAASREIVLGSDPRLSDARRASDVSGWAKAPKKPEYTAEEVGAAESRHTHEPATINRAGFMTAEDKRLLAALASNTNSWTNKEW